MLFIPSVQNKLQHKLSDKLSDQLESTVEIGHIGYRLFRTLRVSDFLIRDIYEDTLIYVRSADARISLQLTSVIGKSYVLDRVTGKGALVRFVALPGETPNYAQLFKKAQRDTTKKFWPYIGMRQISLSESRFQLKLGNRKTGNTVNFRDLDLSNISTEVYNLEIFKKQTRMRIRNLSFLDRSGWPVERLNLNLEITPEQIGFDRINIIMPGSNIHANYFRMQYSRPSDMKDFINKVKLDLDLRQSAIGYRDLDWFFPRPETLRNHIFLSGKVSGVLSDLKIDHLKIQSGFESEFSGDIEAIGLPDLLNTYLFVEVHSLKSSIRDLQMFYTPGTHKQLKLPSPFQAFGNLHYQGNFTGFLSDFVSYGQLQTDIGDFSGDISFRTDSSKQVAFNGQLNTYHLDIGEILGKKELAGKMTMNMQVDGKTFPGNRFRTNLKGIIDSVELNRYIFHQVDIDGLFTEKAYDGAIKIQDPNLRLDFAGLVDFTQSLPEFDFSLNVPHANLFPLHLEPSDSNAFFSCLVLANFKGVSLDTLNGRINLLDAHLKKNGKELELYDIAVKAVADSLGKSLKLSSTYAEGKIAGNYDLNTLGQSLKSMLAQYFPGNLEANQPGFGDLNSFDFELKLHRPGPFNFFIPQFSFKDYLNLEGTYSPGQNRSWFTLKTPSISYGNLETDSLLITSHTLADALELSLSCEYAGTNNLLRMNDLQTNLRCAGDSIDAEMIWTSSDSVMAQNRIHWITYVQDHHNKPFSSFRIINDAGILSINNRPWNLSSAELEIAPQFASIQHLSLNHKDWSVFVDGMLSSNQGDSLKADFRNMVLESLLPHNSDKLNIAGILDGTVRFTGGKSKPLIFAGTTISDLKINNQKLGDTRITSRWDTARNAVVFKMIAQHGDTVPMQAEGNYFPRPGRIDARLEMQNLNLGLFTPYTTVVFPELYGELSGSLQASGKLKDPRISGHLDFNNTSFRVNYINTLYSLSAEVPVEDNLINLNGITVRDRFGNTGTSRGNISLRDLGNPSIDLTVDVSGIEALNITEQDNDIFYGTAFGSGIVSINGPFRDIDLNIAATTVKKTEVYLPLGKSKNTTSVDFVEFVSKDNANNQAVDKLPEIKSKGINMNLDIKVTPEAELFLIFDPSTGEVLRSRGHGDLQLVIKKNTGFTMYGEYTEDEGEYLFSLQNIINKKFRLENGGKITFNGNPLDAELNIRAVYPVKTSLYQLLYDDNYQRRIPVECQILLTGKLQEPSIAFDIVLPTADEDTRSKVRNAITSQEELSKQFLSLLIINSFYPDPSYGTPGLLNTAGTIGATTTEVLSNQLSNWLSQISKDFDIGFSYHPGDEVTSEQVEVALSTQLLNDRVSINGNVDFRGQQPNTTSTNNIVGDFQVEVKLTDNGKLRVKAFTRANDKFIYETAPYTNGIGIFYREEFDSWDALMTRYWDKIVTGRKKD